MTLEILFSIYGLCFSSSRSLCKGKSASYFDILNYFGFCWLADLMGALVFLWEIRSQDFDPVQLCLPLHQHHQPAFAAGIYNFPLVQVVLGINTPKYFQRVKHRIVWISACFLCYILWKYADFLNLVARSGSSTQYIFHEFSVIQCKGGSIHTHSSLWPPLLLKRRHVKNTF